MTLLDRQDYYEYYILPASKEYLADIVLQTMYNVDNMCLKYLYANGYNKIMYVGSLQILN